MPRVGNDVVDLKEKETFRKSADERFVQRVFSIEERDRISAAAHPDRVLWIFWAAKEAAYKVFVKKDPSIIFAHKQFHVQPLCETYDCWTYGGFKGRFQVEHAGNVSDVGIEGNEEYIHALAREKGLLEKGSFDFFCEKIDVEEGLTQRKFFNERRLEQGSHKVLIGRKESILARLACIRKIAERLKLDPSRLEILREMTDDQLGPPFLLIDGRRANMDISLSHHGCWAAGAYSLS
ncbi:MAG: 4'-phosphopantetheinyl transferase superfamily protein [Candidatus Omnitrophica bacterium]|nr:4'-phosphopantetheinyl transferase superfamily protein [Candidatus Omnitrophota bacterium]